MNPKQYGLAGGLLAASFLVGYGTARYRTPVRVQTVEKVVVHTESQTATHIQATRQVDSAGAKVLRARSERHLRRTYHEVVSPDGTRTIDSTVTTDTDRREANATKTASETKVTEGYDQQTHTKSATSSDRQVVSTFDRPNWTVGGLIGADMGALVHSRGLDLTNPRLAYGIQVERRLTGGLYAGVWGLSTGQGGLSLRLVF